MESSREVIEEPFTLPSYLATAGLAEEIFRYLDPDSLISLTLTDRATHGLFSSASKSSQREALLNILMAQSAHIILNEPTYKNIETLKKLLRIFPELLTRKINRAVFEETGQAYINYTLFQLAYAEGDDELCSNDLEPCFVHAFGSKEAAREEIRRQINEKFPEESDEEKERKEAEEKNLLLTLLNPAREVVTNEQFNQDAENNLILNYETLPVIADFTKSFDERQPKEIKEGRRFPLEALPVFFDAYKEEAEKWQNNYYKRYALFEDGILTRVLKYLPQNDVMRGCQGLYYLQEEQQPFERRSTLRNSNINFHEYLARPSSDIPGLLGSFVNIVFGGRRRQREEIRPVARIKTYVEQKSQTCRTYAANQRIPCDTANNLLK